MEKIDIAIERLSDYKSNSKSSLFYKLQIINHSKYFYTYEQSYTRKEILDKIIFEIKTPKGWAQLIKMQSFADLA